MPFCTKCGAEIPSAAIYCPRCGQAVGSSPNPQSAPSYQSSPSELDNLARDRNAQEHWFYRLVAFIIDSIIVGIVVFILEIIILLALVPALSFSGSAFPFAIFGVSLASGLGSLGLVFYFTFAEWLYGRSIGKALFHLRVVTLDGSKLDFAKAFIRNISKIFWLLLLLDVLVGLISKTRRGQKYSDYVANTNVIKVEFASSQSQVRDQATTT
jgi:uncharacterized RDD family membrane protein YckC